VGVKRLLFLVTEDWFFVLHRLPLARAAMRAGYEVIVATRVGACREQIEREGIKLIHMAWKRGSRNPFDGIYSLWKVASIYRQYKPDIIHHVSIKPVFIGTLASVFLRSTNACAIINNFTGMGTLFISNRLSDKLLRWVIVTTLGFLFRVRRAHQLVENEDDKHLLLHELKLSNKDVSVIHSVGVDMHRYLPTHERDGVPIIALVSRLIWDKGVGELVEAGKILRERGLSFRLALIGAPDLENRTAIPVETLRSWEKQGLVELWGYRSDIEAVWQSIHIAVLPSYREGSPMSLIEAAASGRPVVATDVPGCRDIVRHGETGFLVPSGDAKSLADALEVLVRDADLRTRMGINGRKYVESMFGEESVIKDTFELYKSVLSNCG
jgi:glycosyltransferase involved in cell wall biosynthesis